MRLESRYSISYLLLGADIAAATRTLFPAHRCSAVAAHRRIVARGTIRNWAMTSTIPRPPLVPGESRAYPVLPLRDIVVFPHMIVPLFVGREKSIKALEEV